MVMQSKTALALNTENLGRGGWLIQSVNLGQWGHEVILHSIFDPDFPDSTHFTLIFSGCLTLVWNADENEVDEHDQEADVIGFDIHDKLNPKKAVITTDLFSLVMTYQELTIQTSG